jgi:hypothetical protein
MAEIDSGSELANKVPQTHKRNVLGNNLREQVQSFAFGQRGEPAMKSLPIPPPQSYTRQEMRKGAKLVRWTTLSALLLATAWVASAQDSSPPGLTGMVDPLIGTGAGPGGGINLFPGATTPFGMVQLSPDTEDHGYGYHYADTAIQGFSMTHMSGPGCPNEGDIFFTATTGPVVTQVQDFSIAVFAQDGESLARILPGAAVAVGYQCGADSDGPHGHGAIHLSRRQACQHCCPAQPHVERHRCRLGAIGGRSQHRRLRGESCLLRQQAASLAYELVGPLFPKVVIHLREPYAGKTFSIETDGAAASAPYIQSVQLNRKALNKNWISFHSIAAGGTLHVAVQSKPNDQWGAAPDDAPPSLSEEKP